MTLLFGLISFLILALIYAAPLSFFAMLFLGNLGLHLSFMTVLPGAMAAKALFGNFTFNKSESS